MKEDLKPEPVVLFLPCNNTVRVLRSSDINEELDFSHFYSNYFIIKNKKRWAKTKQLFILSGYSLMTVSTYRKDFLF